jgi:DtxR family Mn-dependent transcriptional regulator
MASRTIENYLKQLYLEEQHTPADTPVAMGRLAALMNVVPGTATTMVKALADSGLVRYSPRTGVQLTGAGNQLALHVLRRHRLVELFLVRHLGLDWSEVHEEAEELEHVISEKVLDRMDALLGHPTADPHGDPIPTPSLHVAACDSLSLVSCPVDIPVEITRILDQEPRFLQFARKSQLTPGTRLRIVSRDMEAESMHLELVIPEPRDGGGNLTLSLAAGAKFLVRLVTL